MGYMKAAALVYFKIARQPLSLYTQTYGGDDKLHPFLADVISQRTAWKQPKKKRLPFTMDMFSAMINDLAISLKSDASARLSKEAAILDWMGLGIHTGSRLGEYGQSKPTKGEPFATVPNNDDAGEWAGTPLAFIRDDFEFYDKLMTRQNYRDCLKEPRLAQFLHVRFRYDKSKNNFSTRKFKRLSGMALCPVKRALSILERADILDVPLDYPIGVYRPTGAAPRTFTMITGDTVSSVMQRACQLAYPDPNHYCRLNINLLMSHSNRVTAAVALYNAGINIPVIAYRLRWSVESVTFYLRDCFMAIGPLTEAAINGAYLN
jgi:hypothetical protein